MYLDVLQAESTCFKEEELILPQDEVQQTSDVFTLTEVTEISANEREVM